MTLPNSSLSRFVRVSLAVAISAFAMLPVSAQEICGLASVQYNLMHSDGFESSSGTTAASIATTVGVSAAPEAKAESWPQASISLGRPLGYAPRIVKGVAPTITFVSPSDGATLPGRTFEIRGTFTGPINTGVSINGSPARTFGTQWVAMPIRPPAGPFVITAVATAYDGMTANASRNVTVGNTVPLIELLPKQPGNIAPAVIGFTLRFGGVVTGNVQIDFNGDSVNEYDGPQSGVPSSYTYATPGVYTARAQAIVETLSVSSEANLVIADVIVQRERACAVYGALRTALAAGELEASLQAFTNHQQEALRPFFTSLGINRSVFATRLGTIANGLIGLDSAKLRTLRIEAGLPVAYPLEIAASEDGVWRIASF
ncbi:MAG: hypothetical protein SGI99_10725 [Pseudomonadota bacterium]|nr:hypothetical protein [Pseudomonadota bacterium]